MFRYSFSGESDGQRKKVQNDDRAKASKNSGASYAPKSKLGAMSAAKSSATSEEKNKSSSEAHPPKSDTQQSKEASEPKTKQKTNKNSSYTNEEKEDSSSSSSESGSESEGSYDTASADAEGYDKDRQRYDEERRGRHRDKGHNRPHDDGGDGGVGGDDDPDESPAGGGQGGDESSEPPLPRREARHHDRRRKADIIDNDETGNALVEVLTSLAKRFEKPSRPPLPAIPVFRDMCKDFLRFKKDLKSYFKEYYSRAEECIKVLTIPEKCFSKVKAKICHLDTVKDVLTALADTYVKTDRYVEEILIPIRKMKPLEETDQVCNLLVTSVFNDKLPLWLSEIKDWDMYRNGEGLCYLNEFCMMEQFCKECLLGICRLADWQKARAAAEPQQQHKHNPHQNQNQRDFHKGNGKHFEHDKRRELYWVNNTATNVAQAGQQVSPPKGKEPFSKLNPEARPFTNKPIPKCEFPNCDCTVLFFLVPYFRVKPSLTGRSG